MPRTSSTSFLTVSAPAGDDHLGNLLREVAERLDDLTDATVRDITVAPAVHPTDHSIATVYYDVS